MDVMTLCNPLCYTVCCMYTAHIQCFVFNMVVCGFIGLLSWNEPMLFSGNASAFRGCFPLVKSTRNLIEIGISMKRS